MDVTAETDLLPTFPHSNEIFSQNNLKTFSVASGRDYIIISCCRRRQSRNRSGHDEVVLPQITGLPPRTLTPTHSLIHGTAVHGTEQQPLHHRQGGGRKKLVMRLLEDFHFMLLITLLYSQA